MASDAQGGRRPGPVPVYYFVKGAKARPKHARTQTLTLPELELAALREVTTDPGVVSPPCKPRPNKKPSTRSKKAGPPAKRPPAALNAQQVADLSLLGHQLFELGRLEEARVVFEGLVGQEIRDAFPHTMLGTIYLSQGDQDRALALFEAALQLDRTDLAALVYRAEIRLGRGKVRLAQEDLSRALDLGAWEDPFVDRARRLSVMAQDLAKRR